MIIVLALVQLAFCKVVQTVNPKSCISNSAERALQYQISQPNQVQTPKADGSDEAYPTIVAADFAIYWKMTGDIRFKDAAIRQASANMNYITKHDLPSYPWIDAYSRDVTCRDIIYWYYLYKIIGDTSYLRTAERIGLSFKNLERKQKVYNAKNFLMYGTTYSKLDKSYLSGGRIDPNQNMEIALAFALLYNEPNSTIKRGANYNWYKNKSLVGIIKDEANAALMLQQKDGTIWMEEGEGNRIADTTYWEYTTILLILLNDILPDPEWTNAIKNSGQALMNLHSTEQNLFDSSSNTYCQNNNGWNLLLRTTIWYHSGLNKPHNWLNLVWGSKFWDNKFFPLNYISSQRIPSYHYHRIIDDALLFPFFTKADETYVLGHNF